MALVSVVARNASLAMSYGALAGSEAPTSLEVALFAGDPTLGGTELTSDGGYVRLVVANDATTWPDAPADGSITAAQLEFAVSTDAWSDTASFFLLLDAVTGDEWDSGPLDDEIAVDSTGVIVRIQPTVYYRPPEV